jgi:uncharacterized membrane protein
MDKAQSWSLKYLVPCFSPLLMLVFCTSLVGCSQGPLGLQWGSSSGGVLNGDLSTGSQALTIIQQNCTECHTSSSGPANVYNLTDVNHLISANLIVVGQPSQSTLYQAISSGSMPPSGALSASDQAIISNWIKSLAVATAPTPTPTPVPSTNPTPTPSQSVSFQSLETQIFSAKCIACHSANDASGGYHFDTYAGVMEAVSTSSPASSLVYTITSSGDMPPSASNRLAAAQEALLLQWIEQGAPNN